MGFYFFYGQDYFAKLSTHFRLAVKALYKLPFRKKSQYKYFCKDLKLTLYEKKNIDNI